MAALLHDAIEDCGVTKAELIERFGAPVAELVDGLTKLDKLQFNTREESAGRVVPQDAAGDGARRARHPRSSSPTARTTCARWTPCRARSGTRIAARDARDLRADRAPARPEPDLPRAAGAVVPATCSRGATRCWPRRCTKARGHRRDLIEKVQHDVEKAFAHAELKVRRSSGREKTLYSIYTKMDEKHLSFAQVTDIFGFRIIVPTVPDCYIGAGRAAPAVQAGAGPLQGLHRDPEGQRLPVAAHHAGRPARAPTSSSRCAPRPMHAVAETGVAAHWLYKASDAAATTRRERLGTKWLQSLLDIQNETRDAAEFLGARQDRPVPRRGLRLHAQEPRSWRCRAARRRSTSPTRSTPTSATTRVAAKHQRRAGAAAHRAEERRRRRGRHARRSPRPNPAWLSFVRTGRARSKIRHYLKTLEQAESQRARREAAGAGAARRRPRRCRPTTTTYHASGQQLLRWTGNRTAPSCSPTSAWAARSPTIVAKRLVHAAGRARREARRAADHARALHRARRTPVAGRGAARRQRRRLGAARALLPADPGRRRSSATSAAAKASSCTPTTAASASACSSATASAGSASSGPSEPTRPFETGVLVTGAPTARACSRRWPRRVSQRRGRHHAHRHGRRGGAGRDRAALR